MGVKKILIVEDEPVIATDIEMTLEDLGYHVIGIEDNATDALKAIRKHKPDLVLLDINLEGDDDGVMLAHDINDEFQIPFVYLTSNADKLTINRVKRTHPAGFIVKPFNEKDLQSNIEIALFSGQDKDASDVLHEFFVKDGGDLVKISVEDILFIKADDNYTRIYNKEKSYVITKTLKTIEEKLPESDFIRIHRSFVVNLSFIDKIKDNTLFIGKHSLPISRSYMENLFHRIEKL